MIGLRLNNYELVSVIGEGGMGTVYLARHTFTGRKAAVKLLHPQLAQDQMLVTRFMNEARATTAIGHPNIIDIIDVGILPDGLTPYLMMEFLQGESLGKRLQRNRPLPIGEAIEIACQTASALSAAHARDIIHRDLKPDNLFLVPDSSMLPMPLRVKVLDFGIAKLRGDLSNGSVKTRPGAIMGTPQYMTSRVGDRRGDVQDAPWLCQPFPASCPFRGFHHSVSGPRHIEPDRRISRITAHRGGVFHRGYGSVQPGHAFALQYTTR